MEINETSDLGDNQYKKHPDQQYMKDAKERVWQNVLIKMEVQRVIIASSRKRAIRRQVRALAACSVILLGLAIFFAWRQSSTTQLAKTAIATNSHIGIDRSYMIEDSINLRSTKPAIVSRGNKMTDERTGRPATTLITPHKKVRQESLQHNKFYERLDQNQRQLPNPDIHLAAVKDSDQVRHAQDSLTVKPPKGVRITDNDLWQMLQQRIDHKPQLKKKDTLFKPAIIRQSQDTNNLINQ
ncbi:hypothetical protein [Ferruginibacter sp. HRS2-29]|uniref:hypothetical protein n=1 Tax=Ferruginibacter sp. HRS2-29 TaxID=2487334 RepID=UPI0020CFE3EB|nr:hypothetical protein [Ferruginibacter sp. HRS2-29]MCP9752798.1 hypothetical protein [Ferruginibacter sp. HRS2-29]